MLRNGSLRLFFSFHHPCALFVGSRRTQTMVAAQPESNRASLDRKKPCGLALHTHRALFQTRFMSVFLKGFFHSSACVSFVFFHFLCGLLFMHARCTPGAAHPGRVGSGKSGLRLSGTLDTIGNNKSQHLVRETHGPKEVQARRPA